jgi:hypothetical protein
MIIMITAFMSDDVAMKLSEWFAQLCNELGFIKIRMTVLSFLSGLLKLPRSRRWTLEKLCSFAS